MLGRDDSLTQPSGSSGNFIDPQRTTEGQGLKSVRDLVHENIAKYESAKSNTEKYQLLEGLITFCTGHIESKDVRDAVQKKMMDRKLNFANDFIAMNRAESKSVSWMVILENEYRKLLPDLRNIWYVVHRELITQGLLPWSYPDPMQELQDMIFRRIREKITSKILERERGAQYILPAPGSEHTPALLPREVAPPWVDNDLPDIEKAGEKKRTIIDELLTVPPDVDIEMAVEPVEEGLPPHPDEDLDAITDEEIEQAAVIWKDMLGKKVTEEKEKKARRKGIDA